MKAQTRIGSLLEAAQNIGIGYGISVVATYTIGPWFHMYPDVGDVLGFGGVMTLISIARSYAIRRWNEFKRGKSIPPDFLHVAEEIAAERWKQITREGYTLSRDDVQTDRELARGASTYAFFASCLDATRDSFSKATSEGTSAIEHLWPYSLKRFKPTTPRRDLIKAGAMIVAEIGRIDRAARRTS